MVGEEGKKGMRGKGGTYIVVIQGFDGGAEGIGHRGVGVRIDD